MEAVEALLEHGVSSIKQSISDFLAELGETLEPDITSAITQCETPLNIRWRSPGGLLGAVKITAYQRYRWWLEKVVFNEYDSEFIQVDSESSSDDSSNSESSESIGPIRSRVSLPGLIHNPAPHPSSSR